MKSLHTKILALLLGCVLAASVLIGGAGILCAQEAINRDSAQIMTLICRERAQEIDQILLSIEQSVYTDFSYSNELLSSYPNIAKDKDELDRYVDEVSKVLFNSARHTRSAVAAYLRFSPEFLPFNAGKFIVRDGGGFREEPLTDMFRYDPDDIEHVGWYYIPMRNRAPAWIGPYYNANIDVEMISYVIPLMRNGEPVGVVGMDVDSAVLVDAVRDLTVYESGSAFLVAENGDLVYHRDYPDGSAREALDSGDQELGAFLDGGPSPGEIFTHTRHGQKLRLAFERLCNGMYLALETPASEMDASRNTLIAECVVILATVLTVALILGAGMVNQFTRPLRELTSEARRIADGDWDTEIMAGGEDEVGVLADTLRETIGELQKHIESIRNSSYTDATTGAGNRKAYEEQAAVLDVELSEGSAGFALIALDVENLKDINDAYGHEMGDNLLTALSSLLKENAGLHRQYRISGGGFVVVLDGAGKEDAEAVCRKFSEGLEQFNRERSVCPEDLVVSMGAAAFEPELDSSYMDVYARAERKLHRSKTALSDNRRMLDDAMKMLQMVFHKILKADLTQDIYSELKTYEAERAPELGYRPELSNWLVEFARAGQVHPDDQAEYLSFADLPKLRSRLRAGETYLSVRYRRKVAGEFRWVRMELVTSVEYSDEEQIILLYVRDIHDSYTAELEYNRELERLTNTDSLTGLYNRHYMTHFCQDYVNSGRRDACVVFCDLNGLKYTNDHFGHSEGDKLIVSVAEKLWECFPEDVCCRTGGDEFIICILDRPEAEIAAQVEKLRGYSMEDGAPLASVGYCWRADAENFADLIKVAEDDMYRDKQQFYEKYPQYRR